MKLPTPGEYGEAEDALLDAHNAVRAIRKKFGRLATQEPGWSADAPVIEDKDIPSAAELERAWSFDVTCQGLIDELADLRRDFAWAVHRLETLRGGPELKKQMEADFGALIAEGTEIIARRSQIEAAEAKFEDEGGAPKGGSGA